jgi:hypothetical protein
MCGMKKKSCKQGNRHPFSFNGSSPGIRIGSESPGEHAPCLSNPGGILQVE